MPVNIKDQAKLCIYFVNVVFGFPFRRLSKHLSYTNQIRVVTGTNKVLYLLLREDYAIWAEPPDGTVMLVMSIDELVGSLYEVYHLPHLCWIDFTGHIGLDIFEFSKNYTLFIYCMSTWRSLNLASVPLSSGAQIYEKLWGME